MRPKVLRIRFRPLRAIAIYVPRCGPPHFGGRSKSLLPPAPVSQRNHRRRLQALERRLATLALPAPLGRALAAARVHLEPATPEAAALVLSQLVAPAREVLGTAAGEAVAVAAQSARVHL